MTLRIINVKGWTLAAYATLGSGDNGTVKVLADVAVELATPWTITVATTAGLSQPLSAVLVDQAITVTLGTTGAGLLDATKNTATLVAAAVTALAGVTAYASGTGATALGAAQASQSFGGGKAQDFLLATVAEIKTALEITASTYDTVLAALLDAASVQIAQVTDRVWAQQTYIEKCPGFGDILLNLGRYPLQSITSVFQDSTEVTDYEIANADSGQLYRQVGWAWTAQRYWNVEPVMTREEPQFIITYVAGYVLPNWAGYSTATNQLPANIRQACINTVTSWFKSSYTSASTAGPVAEVSIPGHTIKYANIMDEGKKDFAARDFRLPIEALALLPRPRPWD